MELDYVKNEENQIYSGEWKNGKRCGRGVLFTPEGNIYQGMWNNDKPADYGRMVQANGNVYEGYWKDGSAHGKWEGGI